MAFTILMVCSGNSCRSPMAEGMLHDLLIDQYGERVNVHSAGTLGINGAPATELAIQVCRELEVDISSHRSKGIKKEMILEADLILGMAYHHQSKILSLVPEAENKTFLLKAFANYSGSDMDIEDPIGGNYDVYKACRDEIYELLKESLSRIEKMIETGSLE